MNIEHQTQYKKWGAKMGLKEMDFFKLKNRRMFYGLHYFSFGE
jgi:hypothetical protein